MIYDPSRCAAAIREIIPRSHRRSFREFAETEIIMPNGPRKGRPFSCDFMPFTGELLEEFNRGRFSDFYGMGPVQSGKTTALFVIPATYHLCECAEDIILGAPVLEMAQSAYRDRLLPALQNSRYKNLIPRAGFGAYGRAMSVRFTNGASVRFMGAYGGDQQISSYTARVVIATELDKMDTPGRASRETDPISKLKARSKSFGASARFYGECTPSTKKGRIYQEVVERGTDSRVFLPCQHCGAWIFPERQHLVGWHGKPDVIEARAAAAFQCPACQQLWTEFDRQKSIQTPRVVAKGQAKDENGKDLRVIPKEFQLGPMPPTLTYGFHWNAMSSPLLTMADIAGDEWEAEQSGNEAREKGCVQFLWAEPYEPELVDLNRPEIETILSKIVNHKRREIPKDAVKLTLGCDVGNFWIWWVLVAWTKDAQGHVVDFGSIRVPLQNGIKNPLAVFQALGGLRENIIRPGWGGRQPDRALFDSGWEPEIVYQFIRESKGMRFNASKGFGSNSRHGEWRNLAAAEPSPTRFVGDGYYTVLQPSRVHLVHVEADRWKTRVHEGFAAAMGAPGSLTLWQGQKDDAELRTFARHIVAEQRQYKTVGEKEPRIVWVRKDKLNHYLDAMGYACCAAEIEGIRLVQLPRAPRKPRPMTDPNDPHRIRASY